MTRRAGRLSWTRRVIRCQGKSSREGLATNRDLLRWNVNFWFSSIRSIFYFILFPGITFRDGSDELLKSRIYRPFEGWNCGLRIANFFEKNEKHEKFINSVFPLQHSLFFELWLSRYAHAMQHKILRIMMPSNTQILKIRKIRPKVGMS